MLVGPRHRGLEGPPGYAQRATGRTRGAKAEFLGGAAGAQASRHQTAQTAGTLEGEHDRGRSGHAGHGHRCRVCRWLVFVSVCKNATQQNIMKNPLKKQYFQGCSARPLKISVFLLTSAAGALRTRIFIDFRLVLAPVWAPTRKKTYSGRRSEKT